MASQHDGSSASLTHTVGWITHPHPDGFFQGFAEATDEAILNAMFQADTMSGRDRVTAYGLDGEQLVEVLDRFGLRRYRPR